MKVKIFVPLDCLDHLRVSLALHRTSDKPHFSARVNSQPAVTALTQHTECSTMQRQTSQLLVRLRSQLPVYISLVLDWEVRFMRKYALGTSNRWCARFGENVEDVDTLRLGVYALEV